MIPKCIAFLCATVAFAGRYMSGYGRYMVMGVQLQGDRPGLRLSSRPIASRGLILQPPIRATETRSSGGLLFGNDFACGFTTIT
jgi:hypothetical protein